MYARCIHNGNLIPLFAGVEKGEVERIQMYFIITSGLNEIKKGLWSNSFAILIILLSLLILQHF